MLSGRSIHRSIISVGTYPFAPVLRPLSGSTTSLDTTRSVAHAFPPHVAIRSSVRPPSLATYLRSAERDRCMWLGTICSYLIAVLSAHATVFKRWWRAKLRVVSMWGKTFSIIGVAGGRLRITIHRVRQFWCANETVGLVNAGIPSVGI